MALIQKQNRKKTFMLIGALVVLGTALLIVLQVMQPKTGGSGTGTTAGGVSSTHDLPTYTDFGQDLFQQPQFQELQDYSGQVEPMPIEGGTVTPGPNPTVGNDNPFVERGL